MSCYVHFRNTSLDSFQIFQILIKAAANNNWSTLLNFIFVSKTLYKERTMKLSTATIAVCMASSAFAFTPINVVRKSTSSLNMGFDLSGNNWTPDSEKMGVSICDNIICVNNNNMHGVCNLIFKSLIHFFFLFAVHRYG